MFATLEMFMINLLIRKWKSDDWNQSHWAYLFEHQEKDSELATQEGVSDCQQVALHAATFVGG